MEKKDIDAVRASSGIRDEGRRSDRHKKKKQKHSRRPSEKKRWYRSPFVIAGLAAFLIAIAAGAVMAQRLRSETGSGDEAAATSTVTNGADMTTTAQITPYSSTEEVVAAMPLEEKVGQMMMIGFDGKTADDSLTKMISDNHIGGVIFFGPNIDSAAQVTQLNAALQQTAVKANQPAKLMIAIDQEGGKTRRFDTIGPSYSEPMIGDMQGGAGAAAAQQGASSGARDLKKMGFNANLAPVADVSSGWGSIMDTRSYGTDAQVVATLTAASVKGYNSATTISCVKHFPGLGSADTDPEKDLPVIDSDVATLQNTDLVPFTEAIKNDAPMIMVTHVAVPALDPAKTPASLSKPIMTDLLRTQMGFKGVIITDDLEMGAITQSPGEAAVAAIGAGADIVMFAHTQAKQLEAYDAIVAAVKSGKLDEAAINKSVVRILDMKIKYRLERTDMPGGMSMPGGGTGSAGDISGSTTSTGDGGAAASGSGWDGVSP